MRAEGPTCAGSAACAWPPAPLRSRMPASAAAWSARPPAPAPARRHAGKPSGRPVRSSPGHRVSAGAGMSCEQAVPVPLLQSRPTPPLTTEPKRRAGKTKTKTNSKNLLFFPLGQNPPAVRLLDTRWRPSKAERGASGQAERNRENSDRKLRWRGSR